MNLRPVESVPSGVKKNFPPRILIVEDDLKIRETVGHLLQMEGYEVDMASDATEFLEKLAPLVLRSVDGAIPDAILTDIRMPGASIIAILTGLRKKGWDFPIIVFSAFGSESMEKQLNQIGVTRFFNKPLDFQQLYEVLELSLWRPDGVEIIQ